MTLTHPGVTTPTTDGFARRRFLQGALAVGGASLLDPWWLGGQAFAGPPLASTERILVCVFLGGGNDGLRTVGPAGDPTYQSLRGGLALQAGTAHAVGGGLYMHPNLAALKARFDSGRVAFVHGVGDAENDHSHFTSTARWFAGRPSGQAPTSGWLGRYLDLRNLDDMAGVNVSWGGIPLYLKGVQRTAIGLPPEGNLLGADRDEPWEQGLYTTLEALGGDQFGIGQWAQRVASTNAVAVNVANQIQPAYADGLPEDNRLARELALCARVVNLDLGARVLGVEQGGYDTHDSEEGTHDDLMTELDGAIQAFFATLAPQFQSRVTMFVFSEFGRRVEANDSGGTDHGTANSVMVIGDLVRGGHHGVYPSVTALDSRGDLFHHVDFRSVYATLIGTWLGADDTQILGATYPRLDLFQANSGGGFVPPVLAFGGGYAALTPARLLDTRDGFGIPMQPGQSIELPVVGVGGVPASGVGAVALNVTSTGASARSFITVWPTGQERPLASSLNTQVGQDVPNLVIAKVGADGKLSMYNNAGTAHVVADVVGWFPSGTGYSPLNPARLLDTREGFRIPLQPGQTIDLSVLDVGGVPGSSVAAVALNVTSTGASARSFVTVWPTGEPRPLASSLNTQIGEDVPNLVIAKVGADGKVSMYNDSGTVHLVADVVGWFPTGSGYTPLTPARLLDTREGFAVPLSGGQAIDLPVVGVGGAPASGVTAVVLNITSTAATALSFVTVWPTGEPRPLASSLNTQVGDDVPNLVIAKVGADGKVSMFNNAGTTHLVADLVGWFGA